MTIHLHLSAIPRLRRAWVWASGHCQNSSAEASLQRPLLSLKRLIYLVFCFTKPAQIKFFPVNSASGRKSARVFKVLLLGFVPLPLASLSLAHDIGGTRPLPVIGAAPPFTLTSQDGKPVSLASLRGKVVAVTFIYTACPDICPMLTQKMVDVQDELGRSSAPRSPSFRSRSTRSTIRRRC